MHRVQDEVEEGKGEVLRVGDGVPTDKDVAMRCGWKHFQKHA